MSNRRLGRCLLPIRPRAPPCTLLLILPPFMLPLILPPSPHAPPRPPFHPPPPPHPPIPLTSAISGARHSEPSGNAVSPPSSTSLRYSRTVASRALSSISESVWAPYFCPTPYRRTFSARLRSVEVDNDGVGRQEPCIGMGRS